MQVHLKHIYRNSSGLMAVDAAAGTARARGCSPLLHTHDTCATQGGRWDGRNPCETCGECGHQRRRRRALCDGPGVAVIHSRTLCMAVCRAARLQGQGHQQEEEAEELARRQHYAHTTQRAVHAAQHTLQRWRHHTHWAQALALLGCSCQQPLECL